MLPYVANMSLYLVFQTFKQHTAEQRWGENSKIPPRACEEAHSGV